MDYKMNDFYKKVGLRVRSLRTERNLSREAFAGIIDISSKYVYEIEKGSKNFSIGILYKICTAFNIPSCLLLDEEVSVDQLILNELVGRFTEKDKEHIKNIIIAQMCEDK